MAAGEEPLLQRSDSPEDEALLRAEEEDALLTGQSTQRTPSTSSQRWKTWREIGLFTWALLATTGLIVVAVVYQHGLFEKEADDSKDAKRNLIFMVSDGMGPTSLSLTRSYKQFQYGLPLGEQLVIDQHLIGQSRTRSSSSLVTDSAAGATAFSCGFKSYNGAISVLPDHTPCGTVLEAAKKAGYLTGLVVTTRITDATPACFAAHVNMRSEEDRIAEQLVGDYPLGRVVDIILGGGRCHFLPNSTEGSCREDNKDVVHMAKEKGFTYISSRKEFDSLDLGKSVNLPLLGLFADTDIPYEIDRRNENDIYPSLDEMAQTAMEALGKATLKSKKGFFLMIEGSRIDHAGHANDPAAQVHEVLAYDKAMASVLSFVKKESTQTLMVSTSDHETGGLSTAKQLHAAYPDYLWYPGVLTNVSASAERLAAKYFKQRQDSSKGIKAWVEHAVDKELGIKDASTEEIDALVNQPELAPYTFADMVSRRAQTGWSTHGHSAADVNIYTSSPHLASPLVGNHENTEVGVFLRNYLDVDVEAITKELQAKGVNYDTVDAATNEKVSWLGRVPDDDERLDGQDHRDHYQGDFKKHKRCEICGV